jgi:putative lumazine-binding protein
VVRAEPDVSIIAGLLFVIPAQPSASRPGSAARGFHRHDHRSDDQTAFIKVRCQLPPRYFTDYLVAMKLKDGWKIVSKSYRYDLNQGKRL